VALRSPQLLKAHVPPEGKEAIWKAGGGSAIFSALKNNRNDEETKRAVKEAPKGLDEIQLEAPLSFVVLKPGLFCAHVVGPHFPCLDQSLRVTSTGH
jgi:hypothetical protein